MRLLEIGAQVAVFRYVSQQLQRHEHVLFAWHGRRHRRAVHRLAGRRHRRQRPSDSQRGVDRLRAGKEADDGVGGGSQGDVTPLDEAAKGHHVLLLLGLGPVDSGEHGAADRLVLGTGGRGIAQLVRGRVLVLLREQAMVVVVMVCVVVVVVRFMVVVVIVVVGGVGVRVLVVVGVGVGVVANNRPTGKRRRRRSGNQYCDHGR